MMRHFAERFSTHLFIIYDRGHRIAGVLEAPDKTADERRRRGSAGQRGTGSGRALICHCWRRGALRSLIILRIV